MKSKGEITIIHKPSGEIIAQGPEGWGMFWFEGNYYISKKNLKQGKFTFTGVPGLCFYKFIYFWYHFTSESGIKSTMLGWKYWLPNPLFPFIMFRIAVPQHHPDLEIKLKLNK